MSSGRAGRWLAALVLVTAGGAPSGCHNCEKDREVTQMMSLARFNYLNGNFELSSQLYMNALEKCPDYYGAVIGLANAFREYGTEQFQIVEQHFLNEKPDLAQQAYAKGNRLHADSERYLRWALDEEPDDLLPHYYLGLLWYHRATSPLDYPYRRNDKESRRRDRDQAIKEFRLVVENVPQTFEAQRYLGLALFAAGRTEEGAVHLRIFHDSRQDAYNRIIGRAAPSDMAKEQKQKDLREIEKQIEDVRELIIVHQSELVRVQSGLKSKESSKGLAADERQQLAQISRELLSLDRLIRNFQVTQLAPHEEDLRRRTRDYLLSFNRGNPADVMTFVLGKRGQEARLNRRIREKIDGGTKYRNVRYKSVVVSGESGSVGFECDVVTPSGTRSNSELTLRWHLYSGKWMVYDHP